MIKLYFKQAWNLLKQEKLFSSIYVIGTGLSITIVMVLSIVYYVKIANIYPETNRDRILVAAFGVEKSVKEGWQNSSMLSIQTIETCFQSIKNAEAVGVVWKGWGKEENYVQTSVNNEQMPVTVKWVDDLFWKVFSFRFVEGKSFTQEDFQSGMKTAVISESMARKLFGKDQAVGQYVSLNYIPYRVCGVVKDVSFVTNTTYAQLWIPYTNIPHWNETFGEKTLGDLNAYILAPSVSEVENIRNEALENIQRYNHSLGDKIEFIMNGQPDRYWQSLFRVSSREEVDFTKIIVQYCLIFFILLLVPAVSLSGMADSRMERRLTELGVRRAFGAPVGTLMKQILSENLLFTLVGGAVGLLFSYLFIILASDWIMQVGGRGFIEIPPEGTTVVFTPTMLLNFPVFGIALAVCFLLNLLTAFIPAWKASRKEIVYSLNPKQ